MELDNKYDEVVKRIEVIDKWLLLKLSIAVTSKKDIYLKNSIAKSISQLKSISSEYYRSAQYEGWILFRSLVDRLVYIYYLKDNNLFEVFEEWTFIKSYEYTNKARADEKIRRLLKDQNFQISKSDSH